MTGLYTPATGLIIHAHSHISQHVTYLMYVHVLISYII